MQGEGRGAGKRGEGERRQVQDADCGATVSTDPQSNCAGQGEAAARDTHLDVLVGRKVDRDALAAEAPAPTDAVDVVLAVAGEVLQCVAGRQVSSGLERPGRREPRSRGRNARS